MCALWSVTACTGSAENVGQGAGESLASTMAPGTSPSSSFNSPSTYPVDGEWRADFVERVSGFDEVRGRAGKELDRRIEACMHRRGYEGFSLGRLNGEEIDSRIVSNPLNESTLVMGYHSPPQPEIVGGTDVSPEMGFALDGGDNPSPNAGDDEIPPCVVGIESQEIVDAQSDIDESLSVFFMEITEVVGAYDSTAEAPVLIAEWRDCMGRAGYQYTDPSEPRAQFLAADAPSQEEIAVRRQDFDCDREVKLTESRSSWQRVRYEGWLDTRAAAIKEFEMKVDGYSDQLLSLESEQLD